MKFELEKSHRNITDEELLADVRRVAGELKQDFLTTRQYDESGEFDSSTIKRRFGCWLKGTDKSSLKRARLQQNAFLTEEELFKNLEEAWSRLGRQPRIPEMFPPVSKYCAEVYKRRFGTWMKALEKFVEYINKEEKTSSKEAIKNLEVEETTHKTSRTLNWRLRFIVMRRDNFKCRNCGGSPATDPSIVLHVDHVKPWASGGETVLENLQTLCSVCNVGKSNLE